MVGCECLVGIYEYGVYLCVRREFLGMYVSKILVVIFIVKEALVDCWFKFNILLNILEQMRMRRRERTSAWVNLRTS